MTHRASFAYLPYRGDKINSLNKSVSGNGIGAVLLDGGKGGQSSYFGIDNYIETVNSDPRVRGNGLDNKLSAKLSKLNIAPPPKKPKLKNITMNI